MIQVWTGGSAYGIIDFYPLETRRKAIKKRVKVDLSPIYCAGKGVKAYTHRALR